MMKNFYFSFFRAGSDVTMLLGSVAGAHRHLYYKNRKKQINCGAMIELLPAMRHVKCETDRLVTY